MTPLVFRDVAGWDMAYRKLLGAAGACLLLLSGTVKTAPQVPLWTPDIPAALVGPYIIDPGTLAELDDSGKDCASAGPLNFQCLVYRDDRSGMKPADLASNPFNLPVFDKVRDTVQADLESLSHHPEYGGAKVQHLDVKFLKFAGARIELVGVINRMDRQFNRDKVPEHGKPLECGEISAIYRFGYKGELAGAVTGDRQYQSRLPVTMNVVFPAKPWSGSLSCADVARRWLDYAQALQTRASNDLLRQKARVLASSLRPEDIDRIELNMQGSRVGASEDATDFGTLATYIIRVFRWVPDAKGGLWQPSYLSNQIDRARLLGSEGDDNTCAENRGRKITRQQLAAFLFSMAPPGHGDNAMGDIDNGIVNIPQRFLACRAISVSPGGASRSGNQPFWNAAAASVSSAGDSPSDSQAPGNAAAPDEQIISDPEIKTALERYKARYPDSLGFIGTADEFRARLNDASCSGCHQTRAIAGFHLPGADRGGSPVNAVFLPGSPHFFGDQPRRMEILRQIAAGKRPERRALATSYAARPFNRFTALKPSPGAPAGQSIQLVGGWGGTCLTVKAPDSKRQWDCAGNLQCRALFDSANDPGIGTCVSPGSPRIGEAMQAGQVTSSKFGADTYKRADPLIPQGKPRDTTIDVSTLSPPGSNSYVASHQEYYEGLGGIDPEPGESWEHYARRIRDQETGGFPAGSLRLSECAGLPDEATCGLLAASGFTDCLKEAAGGKRTPESCFEIYTAYSGVRACDPADPCRDDYICLSPMGYTAKNMEELYQAHMAAREAARTSDTETARNRKLLAINVFGEQKPDVNWIGRNGGAGDRRGVCIPPYFVFQFKADGHRVPASF